MCAIVGMSLLLNNAGDSLWHAVWFVALDSQFRGSQYDSFGG